MKWHNFVVDAIFSLLDSYSTCYFLVNLSLHLFALFSLSDRCYELTVRPALVAARLVVVKMNGADTVVHIFLVSP